jgi:hypothetical protein
MEQELRRIQEEVKSTQSMPSEVVALACLSSVPTFDVEHYIVWKMDRTEGASHIREVFKAFRFIPVFTSAGLARGGQPHVRVSDRGRLLLQAFASSEDCPEVTFEIADDIPDRPWYPEIRNPVVLPKGWNLSPPNQPAA